jgi:hypothetical protein
MLPESANPHRLLFFGKDSTLLELRAKVLRSEGMLVDTAVEIRDFTNQIAGRGRTYGGIVCCHSVAETECEEVAVIAGRNRIPFLKLEPLLLPPLELIARALDLVNKRCD